MTQTLPGSHLSWLSAVRAQAQARLDQFDLPTRKNEAWKYTNLKPLSEQLHRPFSGEHAHATITPKNPAAHLLVIHNDVVHVAATPIPGVHIYSLASLLNENTHTCHPVMERLLQEHAAFNSDSFTALNTTLATHGIVIHVEPGVTLDTPIELHVITSKTDNTTCHSQNYIWIEDNASARITEFHYSLDSRECKSARHHVSRILLDKHSTLEHQLMQTLNETSHHFHTAYVEAHEHASYSALAAQTGGATSRLAIETQLMAPHASSHIRTMSLGRHEQHYDTYLPVRHNAPSTKSYQKVKQILDDRSSGVYYGTAHVPEHIPHCEAHQHNKNLLLSPSAQSFARPELHVFTDQVMCTHGSTVGNLDPDALYYLQARGIDMPEARALLVEGFLYEMLKGEETHSPIFAAISEWLKEKRG